MYMFVRVPSIIFELAVTPRPLLSPRSFYFTYRTYCPLVAVFLSTFPFINVTLFDIFP
jgi:hypothetical protein